MKKRFAKPINHRSIEEYDYKMQEINEKEFFGYVSLVDIKKVKDEWYVPRKNGKKECILANGFKWVIFYPKENTENYTINAFYNQNNEIVEWYFDVIKVSGIENNIPYIIDMYLDLVISADGDIYILDEEELEEALNINDISKEDFDMAYKVLNKLLKKYDNGKNIENLKNMSDRYLKEMLKK